jgi:L-xylulokinase
VTPAAATFVGIDVGLSSTKAVVVGEHGQVLGSAAREVARLAAADGRCERDPGAQWAAVCAVTRSALAAVPAGTGPPAAVAVCGHGDGMILADARGQPVRPVILSLDSRCRLLMEQMERDGRMAEFEKHTHAGATPGRPVPLLLWLQAHEPDAIKDARWLMFAKDLVRLRLTGTVGTDYSDAGAGLLRQDRPEYATAALDLLGLGEIGRLLPPLLPSASLAGTVTAGAAAQTGLPAGIPVACGAHDVSGAVIGAGALRPEVTCAIAGTWSVDAAITPAAGLPASQADWGVHQRWFADGTAVLALSSSPSGIDLLAGLAAAGGTEGTAGLLADVLGGPAALAENPGDLLTVIPSLRGFGRSAMPGPAILGFRPGRPDSELARATVEATAFRHRLGIELLGGTDAGRPAEIRVVGGLAASDLWVQLLADATGRPVRRGHPAAGAAGAAALAAVASGAWPSLAAAAAAITGHGQEFIPRPARSAALEHAYQQYRSAFEALTTPQRQPSPAAPPGAAVTAAEGAR